MIAVDDAYLDLVSEIISITVVAWSKGPMISEHIATARCPSQSNVQPCDLPQDLWTLEENLSGHNSSP